jgi:transcriptional regulator with XRE-family HTH domain
MTGKHIRRLRGGLGLNQSDFGRILNVHAVSVSRWENGHMKPDRWTRCILRTIAGNLKRDPGRADRAKLRMDDDEPILALAELLKPVPRRI